MYVLLGADHNWQDTLDTLARPGRQGPLDEGGQLLPRGPVSEGEGEDDGRRPLPAHGVHVPILADLE